MGSYATRDLVTGNVSTHNAIEHAKQVNTSFKGQYFLIRYYVFSLVHVCLLSTY